MTDTGRTDLGPREEELLAELLHGDPADDARALERAGTSPAVRARLADLRRVQAELASAGAEARAEAVAGARAAGPAPGEERALAALRRAMEAGPRGPRAVPGPGPRRRWLPWIAAAAALAALWLARGWIAPADDDSGRGVLLGGAETEGFAPRGAVTGFEAFEWPRRVAEGSVQTVQAWAGERAAGPATVESPELPEDETRWTPSPEKRAQLGARFVWRVVRLDSLGRSEDSPLVAVEVAP